MTTIQLQRRLLELKLYTGKLDGIAGKKTSFAVAAFQKMNGLPDTGEVDQKTLEILKGDEKPPVDRGPFYAVVREDLGALKQSQVLGFETCFQAWTDSKLTDDRWFAYMLGTAWHETARTMQPVVEYGGERYLRKKKYWPFYGRGLVQLTWRDNYKLYGIEDTPDRALDPDLACHIMIDGMTKGVFTKHSLEEYFGPKVDNPVGARAIINGKDRAALVARYHKTFLKGLRAAAVPVPKLA